MNAQKQSYQYKGYTVTFNPSHPESGKWRADRHGCGMNHNNEAGLIRMIDRKVYEAQERNK